jgi:hypothetical protein
MLVSAIALAAIVGGAVGAAVAVLLISAGDKRAGGSHRCIQQGGRDRAPQTSWVEMSCRTAISPSIQLFSDRVALFLIRRNCTDPDGDNVIRKRGSFSLELEPTLVLIDGAGGFRHRCAWRLCRGAPPFPSAAERLSHTHRGYWQVHQRNWR